MVRTAVAAMLLLGVVFEAESNRGARRSQPLDPQVERLAAAMARQPAGKQLVYRVQPVEGEAVVRALLTHPRFEYRGGFRRASLNGRSERAIYRTDDPRADKLELLRRLSWRNHAIDLWTPGGGTIYFGGTGYATEMAILQRADGRYTYIVGTSSSVASRATREKHGQLLLHTHPMGTSRNPSPSDMGIFSAAAAGMDSRQIVLGRNVPCAVRSPASAMSS